MWIHMELRSHPVISQLNYCYATTAKLFHDIMQRDIVPRDFVPRDIVP